MTTDRLLEALERMREFAAHEPECLFATDLSGVNGDEFSENPRRCSCGFDEALALYEANLAAAPVDRDGLREYRFLTWDDTPLVVTVDDHDPGDMGEPRMLVDYDNGPTTYVSVRAAVSEPKERP
jgi:hypothetical protein